MAGTKTQLRVEMERLMSEWRRSGELATSFAKRKGITPAKFFYWKARLASSKKSSKRRVSAGRFVPVQVLRGGEPAAESDTVEIVLASGVRVRVSERSSEQTLRRAIRVLQETC